MQPTHRMCPAQRADLLQRSFILEFYGTCYKYQLATCNVSQKRKGTTGSTNNMETPSQGSSGLAGARCVLAWRNRRDLCLLGETGRICVTEGHLAHQTRKCAKALLVQFPDCSCQKMSAVLKTTQAASGFAKNKPFLYISLKQPHAGSTRLELSQKIIHPFCHTWIL